MSDLGLYIPGRSVIHRMPAGLKLALLVLCGVLSVFLDGVLRVVVALIVAFLLYAIAGFTPLIALKQLRPLLWFVVVIVAFQLLVGNWLGAVEIAGALCWLVLLAALVTLTTRTLDLCDAVVAACKPLKFLGVDPERVGLMLALGIRAIPLVSGFAHQVREAQLARGLSSSPRAFAAPLIVRSLRQADSLGEALSARGVD